MRAAAAPFSMRAAAPLLLRRRQLWEHVRGIQRGAILLQSEVVHAFMPFISDGMPLHLPFDMIISDPYTRAVVQSSHPKDHPVPL